ncbi:hypothetical protein GDO81_028717 [Engystomops pustulosus]|uniref:Uncharacterized protein n=1 Tax=Engystomops pustulosus TaxID=76066 RepID=A0AAV6ZM66_ENGPU|nr:hypothetical protein GDO81_028717 [Engystomops pustulosus]
MTSSAHHSQRAHDVPQPSCRHVCSHSGFGRREPSSAQCLLLGTPHAGFPLPGSRWSAAGFPHRSVRHCPDSRVCGAAPPGWSLALLSGGRSALRLVPRLTCSVCFIHQMAVIGQQSGASSNLTELQVVNLETSHNSKND